MSSADTVWSQSPAGYLEQSWIANTLPLSGLPAAIAERLQVVATGRGEPIEQIVHEIAEFLVTAEDERGEGRLDDAVVFYVENYLLPT